MATIKKPIKKAQTGDTIKKPSIKMTSTKNYDTKETTYPGGDKETVTKFNPRGGFKFDVSSTKSPKKKNGGAVKAKDGKWMQKVSKSIEKRGTKGVCTGAKFGGPTCKPGTKRYALAKTFKSIAKKKK